MNKACSRFPRRFCLKALLLCCLIKISKKSWKPLVVHKLQPALQHTLWFRSYSRQQYCLQSLHFYDSVFWSKLLRDSFSSCISIEFSTFLKYELEYLFLCIISFNARLSFNLHQILGMQTLIVSQMLIWENQEVLCLLRLLTSPAISLWFLIDSLLFLNTII